MACEIKKSVPYITDSLYFDHRVDECARRVGTHGFYIARRTWFQRAETCTLSLLLSAFLRLIWLTLDRESFIKYSYCKKADAWSEEKANDMNNRFKVAVRCWSECLTTINTHERGSEREVMSIIEWFGADSIRDDGADWKDWHCVKRDDGQKRVCDAEMPFHVQCIIDPKQKNNQSNAKSFRHSNRLEVLLCSISATDFFRQVFAVEYWLASEVCWELIGELEHERQQRFGRTKTIDDWLEKPESNVEDGLVGGNVDRRVARSLPAREYF